LPLLFFFPPPSHFGPKRQQTVQPDGAQEGGAKPAEVRRKAVFLQGGTGGERHPLRQSCGKPSS